MRSKVTFNHSHSWHITRQAMGTNALVEAKSGDGEFVSEPKLVEPWTCPHFWLIRKQARHEVGQCQLCGDSKDFTLIQRKDPGWRKVFTSKKQPVHFGNKPIGATASRMLIQGKRR